MLKFLKSFRYAFQGILSGLTQRNFRIHLVATLIIISASIFFQISIIEWLIVLLCIGLVLSVELFNTAIEQTCDLLKIKLKLGYSGTTIIRDLAAGAVLIVAVIAAIIGLVIFFPKIVLLFFL